MGPVGGAEGVVDVEILALAQPVDEGRVVAFLARVEPQVFHELHAGSQFGQPLANRCHRILGIRLALGPTEVAARGDGGPAFEQPLDRGDRSPDTQVVLDGAVLADRDVEVGPQEDPPASRVGQVLKLRNSADQAAPTMRVRSTNRFE